MAEFDALTAIWCGCSTQKPTKICPYCFGCFCQASEEYQQQFWSSAPPALKEQLSSLKGSKQRLGEMLLKAGLLSKEQLDKALETIKKTKKRIGETLVELKYISKEELELFLRKQQVFSVDLNLCKIDPDLVRELDLKFCWEKKILPIEKQTIGSRTILTLAMANPSDTQTSELIQDKTGYKVIAEGANEEEIIDRMIALFPQELSHEKPDKEESVEIKQLILKTFKGAIDKKATCVNFNIKEDKIHIIYTIEGTPYRVRKLPRRLHPKILNELRRLIGIVKDDTEIKGSIPVRLKGLNLLLTVEPLKTDYGENIIIRIVEPSRFIKPVVGVLSKEDVRTEVLESIKKDTGLFIISSPRFHGRVDTYYAIMKFLNETGRKILSIESPMYCPVRGVHQKEAGVSPLEFNEYIPSNETFDKIFLSGIMSSETIGKILDRSGETQIITEMRAKNTAHVLSKILDWNVSSTDLAERLDLILTQVNIRRQCPFCREPDSTLIERSYEGIAPGELRNLKLFKSSGCEKCNGTGFSGNIDIYELMILDDAIRNLLQADTPVQNIYDRAIERGMKPLRTAFLEEVDKGEIRLSDIKKMLR